jgi:hypothetical protein
MRRTTRSALIVLILGLGRPSLSAACPSVGYYLPRPIQCAESVALRVAVDGAALFPGDRERVDAFERRLRAQAIQILGRNRIAIDTKGPELRFEILETSDGGVLIAVSSRGSESAVEARPNVATENVSAGIWRTPNLLTDGALDLFARSMANNWQPDCDPIRIHSANGLYALELPPSHPEARDRYLSSLDEDGWVDASDPRPVGSLFLLSADGEEEKLSIVRLAENGPPEKFLVTDDGLLVTALDDP